MLRTTIYSIRIKREVKLFITSPGCIKIYPKAGLPEGDLVSRVVGVVRYILKDVLLIRPNKPGCKE